MDTGLSFSRNEKLTAAKLNELVRAVNAAGAGGDTPAASRRVVQYHQAAELRMPVEPAGGFYDLRRGLASMGICASQDALACATAWVGHALACRRWTAGRLRMRMVLLLGVCEPSAGLVCGRW